MPELLKFGPTLLLIGFWVFAMRGMSSSLGGGAGGGGPGGMRNIFQVGKANPLVVGKSAKVNTGATEAAVHSAAACPSHLPRSMSRSLTSLGSMRPRSR